MHEFWWNHRGLQEQLLPRAAPMRTALALRYILSGLAFALVTVMVMFLLSDLAFLPLRFTVVTACIAFPAIVMAGYVAGLRWFVILGLALVDLLAFVCCRGTPRLLRPNGEAQEVNLLLRVFGQQKSQTSLARGLLLDWRRTGPVLLIGADDLATETLDAPLGSTHSVSDRVKDCELCCKKCTAPLQNQRWTLVLVLVNLKSNLDYAWN